MRFGESDDDHEAYARSPAAGPDAEAYPRHPENIARAIMQGPPKAEWDFDKVREKRRAASHAD